jgi:hypothetical protein
LPFQSLNAIRISAFWTPVLHRLAEPFILTKALLQLLHENGNISHALALGSEDLLFHSVAAAPVGPLQHLVQGPHSIGVGEDGHSFEKRFSVKSRPRFLIGLFDQEVKVISHHHVSDHSKSEQTLQLSHERDKMLFLSIAQDETLVNAGQRWSTLVNAGQRCGVHSA